MLRPSLIALAAVVMLVAGGGVLAFASWSSRSVSAVFTIRATRVPQVARPTVVLVLIPVIRWKPVWLTPDMPAHRYVVTRHLGRLTRVVCTTPATATLRCVDLTAPPGSTVTYSVRAAHNTKWTGPDSDASGPLLTPGAPAQLDASGEPVAPSPGVTGSPAAGSPSALGTLDAASPAPPAAPEPEPIEPSTPAPSPAASIADPPPLEASTRPAATPTG